MHIGLFLGSFNPVHLGHTNIVQQTLKAGHFQKALIVVSPQSPFKSSSELATASHRIKMCELATNNMQRVEVSDIELHLPKPSYTINTLRILNERHKGDRLTIVLGMDQAERMKDWKDFDSVLEMCDLCFYPRPGYPIPAGFSYNVFEGVKMDISSSEIRERIRNGLDISSLVHPKVKEYINAHQLYLDGSN
jgi:nicotinate-nucleotide adenylyltransferase